MFIYIFSLNNTSIDNKHNVTTHISEKSVNEYNIVIQLVSFTVHTLAMCSGMTLWMAMERKKRAWL